MKVILIKGSRLGEYDLPEKDARKLIKKGIAKDIKTKKATKTTK